MSVENNSLPAFPCEWDYIESNRSEANGMLLRDYFAAKAMIAIQFDKGSSYCTPVNEMNFDVQAATAYLMADAMLKARQS